MKNARAFQHIRFLTQSKTPNNTSNKEHKPNTRFMQKKKDTRKQFTESRPSIGLGDTIQKVTKATGIELLTKFIAGEDCGCDARRHKLNKLFPNRQPLCMTEEEYNWWTKFRETNATTLSPLEANEIAKIWTRIFQAKRIYKPCTCNPKAWQTMINELTSVYETYQVQE